MTKEFFVNAGIEDGIHPEALEILWNDRPSIIDLIPENETTRKELKLTNTEMKDSLDELVTMLHKNKGEATA